MSARHNEELASMEAAVRMLEAAGTPEVAISPLRLPLLDLYVPLRARLELPEGETWHRLKLAGRALGPDEAELLAGRLGSV